MVSSFTDGNNVLILLLAQAVRWLSRSRSNTQRTILWTSTTWWTCQHPCSTIWRRLKTWAPLCLKRWPISPVNFEWALGRLWRNPPCPLSRSQKKIWPILAGIQYKTWLETSTASFFLIGWNFQQSHLVSLRILFVQIFVFGFCCLFLQRYNCRLNLPANFWIQTCLVTDEQHWRVQQDNCNAARIRKYWSARVWLWRHHAGSCLWGKISFVTLLRDMNRHVRVRDRVLSTSLFD